jgi:hypothetical protein
MGVSYMNTFRPVELALRLWAIERFMDGASHGFTFGRYRDKAAASKMAQAFAHMELPGVAYATRYRMGSLPVPSHRS